MFSTLPMVPVTISAGVSAAGLEWPALGAVLAWLLVTVLLGVSVGLMRAYRSESPAAPERCVVAHDDADMHHFEQEAA